MTKRGTDTAWVVLLIGRGHHGHIQRVSHGRDEIRLPLPTALTRHPHCKSHIVVVPISEPIQDWHEAILVGSISLESQLPLQPLELMTTPSHHQYNRSSERGREGVT